MTELEFKNEQIGRNFVLAIALYVVYTALLTTQFAFAWGFGGGFGLPNSKNGFYPATADLVEALYFSTTVFTTVGFGDYVPIGRAAKLYFCFESMVAATHNAAFFSILLIRLTSSSKVRPDPRRRRK
ncbi:potassium channel family protein [Paraburkholderia youngii]|uniref:Two pore domain potassium channel family protein n=1 Tax=Paraburkholderia youngii TaxID=2782701 RepID=A0A7Y6KA61_9BURK|nr:potassium channel family protein [Paraburkholderia youngii]NUY06210.1 two pore domain potassium channel family protein [Paraburkholderia youngii]